MVIWFLYYFLFPFNPFCIGSFNGIKISIGISIGIKKEPAIVGIARLLDFLMVLKISGNKIPLGPRMWTDKVGLKRLEVRITRI